MSITLPEGTPLQLFTGKKLQGLELQRRTLLDLQMPSFIRGDEDDDAVELFYLPPEPAIS